MTAKTNVIIEHKFYSNKSRQGPYWYIRVPGLPPRQYKQRADTPVEVHIDYYMQKYVKGKIQENFMSFRKHELKKRLPERKKPGRKPKKAEKPWQTLVPKKVVSKPLEIDLMKTPSASAKLLFTKLLKGEVKRKNIIDILHQNREKLIRNMSYEFTIYGTDETGDAFILGKFKDIGNRTIEQMLSYYKSVFSDKESWDSNRWNAFIKQTRGRSSRAIGDLGFGHRPGIVKSVKCRIMFTKG